MRKQQVKELIYKGVSDLVADKGFRRQRKGDDGFVRLIPGGQQRIGVALYQYKPAFDFSLTISIRLDEVEVVFNKFSGAPTDWHAETETIITLLEYFMPGEPARFTVVTQDEIWDALATLAPIVRERIIPFLDTHRDVTSLDKAMNVDSVDTSHHPYRGMAALILAHLAGNPRFEQLVVRYRDEMQGYPITDQYKFERLADHLTELRAKFPK